MIRHCGDSECGHYDSCQMMCNLDFDNAVEGEECRHGLERDDYESDDELLDEVDG